MGGDLDPLTCLPRTEGGGQWLRALRARVLRAPFLLAGESVDVEFRLARRSGPAQPPRNLLWDLQREAFIDATQELNQRLAAMERVRVGVGYALTENVRLKADLEVMRDLANRDFLTGLLNRRGGTARLGRMVAPFSLAFVDLDNLRLFNELDPMWNAGDEAIVGVADRLRESFGDDDVVRWAGTSTWCWLKTSLQMKPPSDFSDCSTYAVQS